MIKKTKGLQVVCSECGDSNRVGIVKRCPLSGELYFVCMECMDGVKRMIKILKGEKK